ncbi:MAG: ATP-dependent dethiobiotin synthetase BioD [Microthrixaceae bacterium]
MTRPRRLVVVAGTGTEVGKTWVGAAAARVLVARGVRVGARKPAQSFEADDPTTDADELAAATGEDPFVVCQDHRRYLVPMAPPMAAAVLGAPAIHLAELVAEVEASWPDAADADAPELGLVELAGGVRSPAAEDGDGVDLTALLAPDLVLLVADAGLGTINAVRLTVDALAGTPGADAPVVVHLNRFDVGSDLHRRNRDWLVDRCGYEVTTDLDALADALC